MADEQETVILAVADASFLIGLSMIGQLGLLQHLTDRVVVAPAVWDEVVERGEGRPGEEELGQAEFIEIHAPQNGQAVQMFEVFLDRGEAESLVLAQETQAALFFADDLRARKAAEAAGITVMGVAGILLAGKDCGLIEEIEPLLRSLAQQGFRLSEAIIQRVLREAGETPTAQ